MHDIRPAHWGKTSATNNRMMSPSAPKRARTDAVTRTGRWRETFLKLLAESGNATVAATGACIDRQTAYNTRNRDGKFAAQWAEAMEHAADLLEAEARRRAVEGVSEPVAQKGQLVQAWADRDGNLLADDVAAALLSSNPEMVQRVPLMVRRYSDHLLMFLLRGARPEKFRDNARHTGVAAEGPKAHEPTVIYGKPPELIDRA